MKSFIFVLVSFMAMSQSFAKENNECKDTLLGFISKAEKAAKKYSDNKDKLEAELRKLGGQAYGACNALCTEINCDSYREKIDSNPESFTFDKLKGEVQKASFEQNASPEQTTYTEI